MSDKDGKYPRTFHRFVTRPDIDAPVWTIRHYQNQSVLAPGYWFVAFYHGLEQRSPGPDWLGPHIYDTDGELVWAGGSAFKHWNMFDFGVSLLGDQQRLTLLSNHERTAYILDNNYRVQKTVTLVIEGESEPNMHSFNVLEDGKRALVLSTRLQKTTKESSQRVGYNGSCFVRAEGFREVSLEDPNSQPLFEWNALDWIGLDETTYKSYDGEVESMCGMGWDILLVCSFEMWYILTESMAVI
jgi:hypothetical protein